MCCLLLTGTLVQRDFQLALWRTKIQLVCTLHKANKPAWYGHRSVCWMTHQIVGRRQALPHLLSVSFTVGWEMLWSLQRTGQMPEWWNWERKKAMCLSISLWMARTCIRQAPASAVMAESFPWDLEQLNLPPGVAVLFFALPLPADSGLDLRLNFHWTVKQQESRFNTLHIISNSVPSSVYKTLL